MAERQRRRALLVRLAGLRRHAENGAVAVIQAAAMLLEEPALRDAVLPASRQLTDCGAVR
jgi:hypothetical protein